MKTGRGGVKFSVTLQHRLQETKRYQLIVKGFLTYHYVCEKCLLEAVDKKKGCNSTTEAAVQRFSIEYVAHESLMVTFLTELLDREAATRGVL